MLLYLLNLWSGDEVPDHGFRLDDYNLEIFILKILHLAGNRTRNRVNRKACITPLYHTGSSIPHGVDELPLSVEWLARGVFSPPPLQEWILDPRLIRTNHLAEKPFTQVKVWGGQRRAKRAQTRGSGGRAPGRGPGGATP